MLLVQPVPAVESHVFPVAAVSRIPPSESRRRLEEDPQPDCGKCFLMPVRCTDSRLAFLFVVWWCLIGWVGASEARSCSLYGSAI
nr:hypothetical protein Iba_chr06cCG10540 [Ipomoea batatas]